MKSNNNNKTFYFYEKKKIGEKGEKHKFTKVFHDVHVGRASTGRHGLEREHLGELLRGEKDEKGEEVD